MRDDCKRLHVAVARRRVVAHGAHVAAHHGPARARLGNRGGAVASHAADAAQAAQRCRQLVVLGSVARATRARRDVGEAAVVGAGLAGRVASGSAVGLFERVTTAEIRRQRLRHGAVGGALGDRGVTVAAPAIERGLIVAATVHRQRAAGFVSQAVLTR